MSTSPVFHNLWPTTIMSVILPGSEMANQVLSEFINELDDERSDLTTQYLDQEFLEIDHPVIKWLSDCFRKATFDYTKNAGIKYDVDFHIQAWPNINRFGDYHNLHNHPHSWLSGTYYVSVPLDDPSIGSRNDLNPNNISFYDPRPQANMISINGDKQVDPEFRHNPKSGELLLWPAFLHHFVHPNLCHVERISVSFNIVLKWKKEYVPK